MAFANDTGSDVQSVTIGFNGEQWRNGGNTTAQTMALQYGTGAAFTNVANWITPGGNFDWTSVVNTGTAAAVDGNGAGLVSGRGGTITFDAISFANGETLWVRWVEVNDAGNDHGLAIDNFTLTYAPVPEPTTVLAVAAAGVGLIGVVRRIRPAAGAC